MGRSKKYVKKSLKERSFKRLVPEMGLEPIWISPFDFKSNAYTNSAIRAYLYYITG